MVRVETVSDGTHARWLLSLFEMMRPVIPDYVQYDVHFSWGVFALAALVASASTVLFIPVELWGVVFGGALLAWGLAEGLSRFAWRRRARQGGR